MADVSPIIRFVSLWNEPDPTIRAETVAELIGDSFVYSDPHAQEPASSAADMRAFLATFHANVPGAEVAIKGEISEHHGHAMARLSFAREGSVFAHGIYYFELTADGRIARAIGFMDPGA